MSPVPVCGDQGGRDGSRDPYEWTVRVTVVVSPTSWSLSTPTPCEQTPFFFTVSLGPQFSEKYPKGGETDRVEETLNFFFF